MWNLAGEELEVCERGCEKVVEWGIQSMGEDSERSSSGACWLNPLPVTAVAKIM